LLVSFFIRKKKHRKEGEEKGASTMDLLQLKYFQTIAKTEHITKASEELQITQPSLSQMLAKLEKELGVPLFDRRGRSIRLNESGKAFLRRVERAFFELEEGRRDAIHRAGQHQKTVSFATIPLSPVTEAVGGYLNRYPDARLRLDYGHSREMAIRLERGEIDLCLSSPLVEGPDIGSIPVITEEIWVMVPPGHRLAGLGEIRLNELADDPFICLKEGFGFREMSDHFCRLAGFMPNVVFEAEEFSMLQPLVKSGIGVALLPAFLWRADIGSIHEVLRIREPVCRWTIWLAWRQQRELSPESRRFKEYLIDFFGSFKKRETRTQPIRRKTI